MTYPETCFSTLIALKNQCEPPATPPAFYLDDVPGVDITKLSNLATADSPTGADLGQTIIDSASRLMAADVEAIYDARYKVQNTLVAGCSICTFTSMYATGNERGTLVKNNTLSSFASLVIEKFDAKINATGSYTIVLDDGNPANLRLIPWEFQAGVVYEFREVGYITKQDRVRFYLLEPGVPLAQLSCPSTGSGCGCSSKQARVVTDLVYTGTLNGEETQLAYGFIPCAFIRCDSADLLCFVAKSAPRMIGMALLFKAAELYFRGRLDSSRNNKTAGTNVDQVKEDAKMYNKLYLEKLNGTAGRGVKDLVFTTLQQVNDVCVVCSTNIGTAWAAG